MTPAQQTTVNQHKSEGFTVILEAREIVRLTKGADKRLVLPDGSVKRGNHMNGRNSVTRGCV
jgi:hypothetical protein